MLGTQHTEDLAFRDEMFSDKVKLSIVAK